MIKITNYTDRAVIELHGVIVDDTDANWLKTAANGEVIGYEWPAKVKEQIEALKGTPIDLHIASDGGNVGAGIALYNMLAGHDAPVTAYIDVWAASIASYIAFAGNKIVMPANTFIMIHNPTGGAMGEASYLRSVADWLDKIRGMMADKYAENSEKLTKEELQALMDKETWLTAQEAKDIWGEKIQLTDSTDLKAVACYSGYSTAPQAIRLATEPENNTENAPQGAPEAPDGINTQADAPTAENEAEKPQSGADDEAVRQEIINTLQEAMQK